MDQPRTSHTRWNGRIAAFVRCAAVYAVLAGFCAGGPAFAQLRLGEWLLVPTVGVDLAYDSNVDDSYPEEESETLRKDDFYWMPTISLGIQPKHLRPNTTLGLSGTASYMDYFRRDDSDTLTYDAQFNFQASSPRLQLGGNAGANYSIENSESSYRPGGVDRDPSGTYTAGLNFSWNFYRFRVTGNGTYTVERHKYEKYKDGDNDELDATIATFFDLTSWLALTASYEWDQKKQIQSDEITTETTLDLGVSGNVHPKFMRSLPIVTYFVGASSKDTKEDDEGPTWEPKITLSASDQWRLSRDLTLAASLDWTNDENEDEVSTTFNVTLNHTINAYLSQMASASLEPRKTFGSNSDTETITYTYAFNVKDLLIPHLHMGFTAEYKMDTPLGDTDAWTEHTTTLTYTAGHSRPISRRLSRNLDYTYTWENSNFHDDGAKMKHLVVYGFSYRF